MRGHLLASVPKQHYKMSIPTHLNRLISRAISELWIKVTETDNDVCEPFTFNYDISVVLNALNKRIEFFDEQHEGYRLSCPLSEGKTYYLQVAKEPEAEAEAE